MAAINSIAFDHFSGGRAITHQPSGDDDRSLEDILNELIGAINGGAVSQTTSVQKVAATEEEALFIAPANGEITYVAAKPDVAAAAGESMTLDVQVNGATVLTVVVTLNDTTGTTTQVGTLIGDPSFSQDDVITVERTYVAGGAPTMTVTTLTAGVKFAEPSV